MAETVKKSRIVSDSDDNLEESLMEEFNIRLKNCMSQDDLKDAAREEDEELYENVEVVKTNGSAATRVVDVETKEDTTSTSPVSNPSYEFIQVERDSYYDQPAAVKMNGHGRRVGGDEGENDGGDTYESTTTTTTTTHQTKTDFYENAVSSNNNNVEDQNVDSSDHYEPVEPKLSIPNLTFQTPLEVVTDESGDNLGGDSLDGAKSVKDRMFLSTDDTSCLLFTQTVTSPMLTPSEENIDFLKGFRRESTSTQNTSSDTTKSDSKNDTENDVGVDLSPPPEAVENEVNPLDGASNGEIVEDQSAKVAHLQNGGGIHDAGGDERIYENAEFLTNPKEQIYENLKGAPVSQADDIENVYENVEDLRRRVEELEEETEETVEDNTEDTHGQIETVQEMTLKDNQSEPLTMVDSEELVEDPISENVENLPNLNSTNVENVQDTSGDVENLRNPKGDVEIVQTSNDVENVEFVDNDAKGVQSEALLNGGDGRKSTTPEVSPSQLVETIKSQLLKSPNEPPPKDPSKDPELQELQELKTLNIMKHISKFEHIESETNSTTSSQMSESTYVETSTVVETTKSADGQDKSLKKKKSKKSRSHEKENISVSETNISNEENYYNVNVKSLCRSFGDLTKIGDEKCDGRERTRTKSMCDVVGRTVENVFGGVSVKALRERFLSQSGGASNSNSCCRRSSSNVERPKSSFSKFDALQKKNVLHVRSSDSAKAQEKFNGSQIDNTNCKSCSKPVFQMEQIKAEKAIWHKNCFRCHECKKQLNVDTYESNEGLLYCKAHFKALFAPKVVEDDTPTKPKKHELIIRENQPKELPPDVVRASDKPDLGLEELHSLNVKERFQVFEHHEETNELERTPSQVNVKRSPSILSKLARFQAKGMDIGVSDDVLNGIPIEESSSEEEEEEEETIEGEDADLIRAKRAQKEKPFHFVGMSDVKSKWEQGDQHKDERREERKQEIQTIRNRLFMGKQGKMKEAYQQAVMESESGANVKKSTPIEVCDTRSLKERFEKGEVYSEEHPKEKEQEDMAVFESAISKKSRSIFQELDANASKPPRISPVNPQKLLDVKKARDVFLQHQTSEDVVKSSEQIDDVTVQTADIQQRFKFFETYKEPEKQRKEFRITPPRDGQVKAQTPEREVYRDPEIVRAEEYIEDSVVAKESHTATKMLNKFRQMEENMSKEQVPAGPKPLKRFTPPPEPVRQESSSGEEESGSEEESEENETDGLAKVQDEDLIEAQKAARAKQLRAKFEKWEANEIRREQNNSSVNIAEEIGEDSQVESTKTLRARFESMRESKNDTSRSARVKVNRFVEFQSSTDTCEGCGDKVYPLEKLSVHGHVYHKGCFKCMECNAVLRMDSYSYNQGLLYCMPHFKRLFISKGNYDSAFGLKEKWNTSVA